MKTQTGQSTVEYLLLFAAVLLVLLIMLGRGGLFERQLNETYKAGSEMVDDFSEQVF